MEFNTKVKIVKSTIEGIYWALIIAGAWYLTLNFPIVIGIFIIALWISAFLLQKWINEYDEKG